MGTKCVLWSTDKGDIPADLAFKNNFSATSDPAAANDLSQGYRRGSVWLNRTAQTAWLCLEDTTGAAVWIQTSSAGEQNAQFTAPQGAASAAGGQAKLTGGAGGSTTGAGGASTVTGGAATAGNSAGGAGQVAGGAGQGTGNGGAAQVTGGASGTGATGNGGAAQVTGGAAGSTNGTGGAAAETGGAGSGSGAGGAASITGGVGGATGAGGAASVTGGAGGATSGAGGQATVTGGAGSAGNANGGSVIITGGAKNGSGIDGAIIERGVVLKSQAAQATQDTSATLTTAQILNGIIQSTPSGAINLTLPTQANMDSALPDGATNDSFDFSIINTSGGANTITVLANSWTTVGTLTIAQNVSGRFRARKTGAGAWTLYRIS